MKPGIEKFKNSDSLTDWVKYLIDLQIIVAGIVLLSNFMEYQILSDFQNGVYKPQNQALAEGMENTKRQQICSFVFLATTVISSVLILKWIYRVNYNARQLGAKNMNFSPGGSIGWYFIPIFSLWKPYQAMKEIWKASHTPSNWKNAETSSILGWWWFFFIVASATGNMLFRLEVNTNNVNELINLNLMKQAYLLLVLILAIITKKIITQIYSAQLSHVEKNNS